MAPKFAPIVFLCLSVFLGFSQKVVKRSVIAPSIDQVQVDVAQCYLVEIRTIDGDEMEIEAVMDGEYRQDLSLHVTEEGSVLKVGTGFHPDFSNPNDKLSAHKVISISLAIALPRDMKLQVFGTDCNVRASGEYKNLRVTLADGECLLNQVRGDVEVHTQSGPIYDKGSNALLKTVSQYGTVYGNSSGSPANGTHSLVSVTGDIHLTNTE